MSEPTTTTNESVVDRDSVERSVRELIAKHLEVDVDQVQPDARLLDLPRMDSLRLMQGILIVEEKFGVQVDESRAIVVRTVAEVSDLVAEALRDARQ